MLNPIVNWFPTADKVASRDEPLISLLPFHKILVFLGIDDSILATRERIMVN